MRTLLVSICCLSLACLAGAAQQQQEDQGDQHGKKKGGQNVQSQQVVAPTPNVGGKVKSHTQGNVSGAGAGAGANVNVQQNATLRTHHGKVTGQTETNVAVDANNPNLPVGKKAKFKAGSQLGGSGQTNVSGQANVSTKNTTFNKSVNKNITVNKNFKVQHFNLANKPNPNIPNVKFKAGYQVQGAQNWKGQKYVAFKNYKAQWHDKDWWKDHHNHIVFVNGGWYFWDGGYCYPAWGYAPDAYYAYDGPIYVGSEDMDPGQVVANVQAALQEQGFYQGEVDGILGPQTRAALAEYQSAQGLEPTGAIDEPTLETLGMV